MDRREFLKAIGLSTTSYFVFGSGLWRPDRRIVDTVSVFGSGALVRAPNNEVFEYHGYGVWTRYGVELPDGRMVYCPSGMRNARTEIPKGSAYIGCVVRE